MEKNTKTEGQKNKQKLAQKNKQKCKAEKEKYFAYYDDIKVGSHKVVDW